MKNSVLSLLSMLTILSCRPHATSTEDSSATGLNERIALADKALKASDPAKGLEITSHILHHLPAEAAQSDSTIYYSQKAFAYYCSFILLNREFPAAIEFLNSLAASPTPFLQQHALPELTAIRSHLYLMSGQMEQAAALADSFCLLPPIADKERFMKYNEMAATAYYYSQNTKEAIRLLKQAVEASRQGGNSKNMGRMLAWLAIYYHMEGSYEEAMRLNQEAMEFYQHNPEDHSTMVVFNEQAALYQELGMYNKALEMNQQSIGYALRNKEHNLTDAYCSRASIFQDLKQTDSIFHCLNLALASSLKRKNLRGVYGSKMDLLNAYLLRPDSLVHAKPLMAELCADSANAPQWMRAKLCLIIGKVRYATQQPQQAIEAIQKAVKHFNDLNMSVLELDARTYLMDMYRQTGQQQQLAAGYARYAQLKDTLHRQEVVRMVAAANIGYDTRQKEQQNRLLTAEVALKDVKLNNYLIGGISFCFVVLCAGFAVFMRQRSLRLHLRLQEQEKQLANTRLRDQEERLQQLIASRQQLNNHNEELLQQLIEVQTTHDKTCDLDHVMEKLQPRLLTNEEEEQFRTAFTTLHPTVITRLRTVCPRATRSDELLCMLIILNQTNDEIARTLGISRSSVFQNRYRLRSKLQLPEGSDFDTEVKKRLLS